MQTSQKQIILFFFLITFLIFLLAALTITVLYLYKKYQLKHIQHIDNLRLDFEKNLLKTQIEIQEQTFQTISRDIHDNINLSLTLAKLHLNTIDWNNIPKSISTVGESVEIIGNVITDLRDLSKSMNTEIITNLGLVKALKEEVEKLAKMANLQILYEVKGEPIFMESDKELVIFRIIQESFNNIVKHARASNVSIKLIYTKYFLDVLIRDDGVGFSNELVAEQLNTKTAGIINMQTRANLFGGKLIMETWPQKGTQVLLNVPY
jgi:two-component system, NarL family, sensor kinase